MRQGGQKDIRFLGDKKGHREVKKREKKEEKGREMRSGVFTVGPPETALSRCVFPPVVPLRARVHNEALCSSVVFERTSDSSSTYSSICPGTPSSPHHISSPDETGSSPNAYTNKQTKQQFKKRDGCHGAGCLITEGNSSHAASPAGDQPRFELAPDLSSATSAVLLVWRRSLHLQIGGNCV
ncbi:hypothetical protein Baya_12087 [Bagarius yarrelli]|uniref:Uncharacterized protein n=1 Tax=Bagarius yarrelli TaxID=175774 RepID=A0A556V2N4_BAGYA|nr:hypothetical protein Baya_12087 [Bagarius yarrelli]